MLVCEAALFFAKALPIALVDAIKLMVPATTTMTMGRSDSTSTTPLAAATLGVLAFNIAGNMVATAPLNALDTIASQAYGAGNTIGVGLAAQRALLSAVILVLPTAPLWIWNTEIFVMLGQPHEVAELASKCMRLMLPGLVPFVLFEAARKFLYAQGVFSPPLLAAAVGLASHAVWLELLCHAVGLGASGAPLALCCTYLTMALVLVVHIRLLLPVAARAWPRDVGAAGLWSDRAAWRHFAWTSASSLISLTEWLFWEFVCLRVGALGTLPLSTYTVGYSLEPCLFMLPIGLSTGLANSVGSKLGGGHVEAARRLACVGVLACALSVLSYALCTYEAGAVAARLFSSDAEVLSGAAEMWPSFSAFLLVSGAYATMLGLNRGLGLQHYTAGFITALIWPLGCPLVLGASSPAQVWQRISLTYTLLTAAMALAAACCDWRQLSQRAIAASGGTSGTDAEKTAGGSLVEGQPTQPNTKRRDVESDVATAAPGATHGAGATPSESHSWSRHARTKSRRAEGLAAADAHSTNVELQLATSCSAEGEQDDYRTAAARATGQSGDSAPSLCTA